MKVLVVSSLGEDEDLVCSNVGLRKDDLSRKNLPYQLQIIVLCQSQLAAKLIEMVANASRLH